MMKQRQASSPRLGPSVTGTQASYEQSPSAIIVLSYVYSGAALVQEALATDTTMACTAATGILPLCETAAETWKRIDGGGRSMSRLAMASVRALIAVQVTAILAGAGKARWCELATTTSAAESFARILPNADIVCVHRSSLDMIRAGIRANPWGLRRPGLLPYIFSHPGNSIAALAEYWADSTEQLLALEASSPDSTHRIRYEDVTADQRSALAAVRASLGLYDEASGGSLPQTANSSGPATNSSGSPIAEPLLADLDVPTELIPPSLQERISRLHVALGYPPIAS
jgi:hypothetical protein